MPGDRDAFGNPIGGHTPAGLGAVPGPRPAALPSGGARVPTRAGAPEAPGATAALVLGIIGVWLWLVAPFAWVRGRRTLNEINASMGQLGGRTKADVGRVLGIIGTVLLVLTIALGILGAADHHH
jgi:hypothetical protein